MKLAALLGIALAASAPAVLTAAAAATAELPGEPPVTEADRAHWSFRPLAAGEVPALDGAYRAAARNPVDHFIHARLAEAGLEPAPEADRNTLVRRLTFDLTGLPPTPEEVEAFVADRAPDAYGRLVDRLLTSPGYGERWAQHWLDVARFAETDGFEHDHVRPESWRYRDWVIAALDADLPFDRFVGYQVAGDQLAPGSPGAADATGFLLAGPDMPDINLETERRHNTLNEMTSAVGAAFLGLSLGCAQCHDHKSDPVSQADFYRLRAYFANLQMPKKNKSYDGHRFTDRPGPAPPTHVAVRGDFRREGARVEPAVPRVVAGLGDGGSSPGPAAGVGEGEGGDGGAGDPRAGLARWLARPDHPLVTRVAANRLWQHHFGRPLVATPNDFGVLGARPSHPLLLDWLAAELPRRGWSLKAMHRLLVNSAAYRRASRGSGPDWERARALDPENNLLWRMNRRRLGGEELRDALLAAPGRLEHKRGGPGVRPPLPSEVTATLLKKQWEVTPDRAEHHRRSIYLFVRRNLRFPLFDAFDRPDANQSCARRNRSTTAVQALTLINSAFTLDAARSLAGAVAAENGSGKSEGEAARPGALVDAIYRRALGRPADPDERAAGASFLREQAARLKAEGRNPGDLALPTPNAARLDPYVGAALTDLCLAVFNLNEMIYVD